MKWKIKKPDCSKNGDIRIRRVFAWRKTRVGDYYVWFETYQVTEKYFVSVGGNQAWWSEVRREILDYVY